MTDTGRPTPPQPRAIRVFRVYTPPEEDLNRARELAAGACPRRYCWWWHTLAFDWEMPVEKGCTFVRSQKPPGWLNPDMPCCRCAPSSDADQYEPREPHLIEDGIDGTPWLELKLKRIGR